MNYTTQQRKEIHDQLVAAKKLLWRGKGIEPRHTLTGKQTCICAAISRTKGLYYHNGGRSMLACKVISNRLGGEYIDLEDWLRSEVKVPENQLTDVAIQTYRHEWLDHLIAEHSN